MQWTQQLAVQFSDTDAATLVFYPRYLEWFDAATHAMLRGHGYPEVEALQRGNGAIIAEAHGRFVRPLSYADELQISSHVAEVRIRAFRVEHVITRNSEVVCEGYEVRVWAHFENGRAEPLPIPDDLRRMLVAP